MELLTLTKPDPDFPRAALDSEGGFLWWYLDLIDADGNGAVVIWSFGLPFLPGYASSARRKQAPRAADRPSLNVAVYREWELDCYLLHEFDPAEVEWGSNAWTFGDSVMTVKDTGVRREVFMNLNAPLPAGDRLTGTIRAEGLVREWNGQQSREAAEHAWAPQLCRASGSLDLSASGQTYLVEGDAYFDGNYGSAPLGDTLDRWCWGRIPLEDRELVYYVLTGTDGSRETHGFEMHTDGQMKTVELRNARFETARSRTGLRYPTKIRLETAEGEWITVEAGKLLDDGPFYVRHQITTSDGHTGLGEFCRTDRIDLWHHRPLVRMRVQHSHQPKNSIWLPLFTGPRRGRVSKLVSHWATS